MSEIPAEVALDGALRRRTELEAELEKVNTFLKLYEQFSGMETGVLTHSVSASSPTKSQQETQNVRVEQRASIPGDASLPGSDTGFSIPQREFTDLTRSILLTNAHPLTSVPLLARFHAMGRRLGGKDELRNLTTKLWRAQNEIIKIPGAGYWPVDTPCPAVSYSPSERLAKNEKPSHPNSGSALKSGDDLNEEKSF